MVYLLFFLGLGLLFIGGKYLVEGSVSFARDLKLSPLLIGIVLVGFGTSVPELITCIKAVLVGSSEIVIGNIIGSNIANILLILATGALICDIAIDKKSFKRDSITLLFSSILLTIFCFIGYINFLMGLLCIIFLALYMFVCYRNKSDQLDDGEDIPSVSKSAIISFIIAILGIVGVMIGANLLVESSIKIARILGISENLIALSAIALGTSLPELAAIIIASIKKHGELALGNIIGSNIFNILAILGVTSMIKRVEIIPEILKFDVWAMNIAVLLMIILSIHKWKLTKIKGLLLLFLYIVYMIIISFRG